jgi:putative endonuclease
MTFYKSIVEQPEPVEGEYKVYILQCSDESYYCGVTNNLSRRIKDHALGTAATWTAKRLPVKVVYQEVHQSLVEARRRENQIKGWTRIKKEKLIRGTWKKL